jgi:hypothetical protein
MRLGFAFEDEKGPCRPWYLATATHTEVRSEGCTGHTITVTRQCSSFVSLADAEWQAKRQAKCDAIAAMDQYFAQYGGLEVLRTIAGEVLETTEGVPLIITNLGALCSTVPHSTCGYFEACSPFHLELLESTSGQALTTISSEVPLQAVVI